MGACSARSASIVTSAVRADAGSRSKWLNAVEGKARVLVIHVQLSSLTPLQSCFGFRIPSALGADVDP